MTALTTVMGLVPMAMTEPSGESFDYRALATCVAGGLTFSTLFTLWVVPVGYTLFDDLGKALTARAAWIGACLGALTSRVRRAAARSRTSPAPPSPAADPRRRSSERRQRIQGNRVGR